MVVFAHYAGFADIAVVGSWRLQIFAAITKRQGFLKLYILDNQRILFFFVQAQQFLKLLSSFLDQFEFEDQIDIDFGRKEVGFSRRIVKNCVGLESVNQKDSEVPCQDKKSEFRGVHLHVGTSYKLDYKAGVKQRKKSCDDDMHQFL